GYLELCEHHERPARGRRNRRAGAFSRRAARQRPHATSRHGRGRGAALHPLRRLPQSLSDLWRRRRTRLWRHLFGADRRRAQSRPAWRRRRASSSQRQHLLRTLRRNLPGQDSVAENHAPLARAGICEWTRAQTVCPRIVALGVRGKAPMGISHRRAACGAAAQEACRKEWLCARAAADARLVRGSRSSGAGGQDLSRSVARETMSAREDILSAIRARCTHSAPHPPRWDQPAQSNPLLEHFAERAGAAAAQVKQLAGAEEIPEAIAELL